MESAQSASLIVGSIEMCVMPKERTGSCLAFIVAVALSKPGVEQGCKIGGGKRGKADDRVVRGLIICDFNSCHCFARGQTRKCDGKPVSADERPAMTLKISVLVH